jgi:hypothetical protein
VTNDIPLEEKLGTSKSAQLCFAIVPMGLAGCIVGLFTALLKNVQATMFGFRPQKPPEPEYALVFFGWIAGIFLGYCFHQIIGRFRFFAVSLGWLLGLLFGFFILVVFGDGHFSVKGFIYGILLPFFTCLFGGGGIGVICAIKKQAANRYGYRTLLFGIIVSFVACEVICWRIVNPHFIFPGPNYEPTYTDPETGIIFRGRAPKAGH